MITVAKRIARPRWYPLYAIVIVANFIAVGVYVAAIARGSDAVDFATYAEAVRRYGTPDLYDGSWWYGWRYSPIAVFPLALVTWAGEAVWRALHVVALLALPGWRRWAALASFPFWFDVAAGNVLTFVTVLAYWAIRGHRWATGALLATALLIPRPLVVPLVGWILWKRPEWRYPFAALAGVHTAAVLLTGHGDEWIATLATTGDEFAGVVNLAPSAFIGAWWLVFAAPLAAIAFLRGYPGMAGLMLQPYWLPYYLLIPLADRVDRRRVSRDFAFLRWGYLSSTDASTGGISPPPGGTARP